MFHMKQKQKPPFSTHDFEVLLAKTMQMETKNSINSTKNYAN